MKSPAMPVGVDAADSLAPAPESSPSATESSPTKRDLILAWAGIAGIAAVCVIFLCIALSVFGVLLYGFWNPQKIPDVQGWVHAGAFISSSSATVAWGSALYIRKLFKYANETRRRLKSPANS